MKYLQFCTILLIVATSLVKIESFPIDNSDHQVAIFLPELIQADLPASTDNPEKSITAALPLTLLNVEEFNESSEDVTKEYQRRTRNLGLSGFGGFGGLGGKFSGLGLGGFGGLGGWGLGGLHGFGFGGFKPFFGHHFG